MMETADLRQRYDRAPCCPKTDRRGSSGLPVIEFEKAAEARTAGDPAICPVVVRRTTPLPLPLLTEPSIFGGR